VIGGISPFLREKNAVYTVLPAYNEEKSFESLIPSIGDYLREAGLDYKIIVCNDGSDDGSAGVLDQLRHAYPIEVLTHKINRGLGETSRDLFERAAELARSDDVIVRLDCDNTHEPKYITKLIEKLDDGFDVVTASRFEKGGGQSDDGFDVVTASRFEKGGGQSGPKQFDRRGTVKGQIQ